MQTNYNGHTVNYISKGEGPPIILIHGIAGSLLQWQHVSTSLVDRGYRVYALDLLGHGDSAKPDASGSEGYHVDVLYAHLANWISSLRLKQKPVLVGHSVGGYLSLCYTLRNPGHVRGVTLVNPFITSKQLSNSIRFTTRQPRLSASILRAAPQWTISKVLGMGYPSGCAPPKEMREQMARDYKRAHPAVLRTANSTDDLTRLLPRISSPTLVIWGEKDQTLSPTWFPKIRDAIPNATAHIFPECGHTPHITQGEKFSRLVLNYLLRLGYAME